MTEPQPQQTRYQRWLRRVLFGPGVSLGFYAEFWRPGLDRPREAGHWLIADVVHSAGGIEYTVGKIDKLIAAAQAWADANIPREADDVIVGLEPKTDRSLDRLAEALQLRGR